MAKNMKKIFLGILIICLSVFISGIAVAGSQVSISGVINEDDQLVDNDGMAYDIADNEKGEEVMEMVGQISVEEFGSLNVYDEREEPVKLSTLWQKGTAVLVFVRHFG